MSKEPKCYIPVNDQKLAVSFEEDKKIAAFWNMHNVQESKGKRFMCTSGRNKEIGSYDISLTIKM